MLVFAPEQVRAFAELQQHYADCFASETADTGLPKGFVADRGEIRQLTGFFAWSARAASTGRPRREPVAHEQLARRAARRARRGARQQEGGAFDGEATFYGGMRAILLAAALCFAALALRALLRLSGCGGRGREPRLVRATARSRGRFRRGRFAATRARG